ncbi:MAG: ABC transporter substrate-binding protein, partial [Firmicutes bacterium]|nr:ABC transporter substrate-binding protein [Bacillota bacterium]
MFKYIKFFLLVVSFILILAILILKYKGKTDKIRVCEVTRSLFYAPQYVAISEGFFSEQGLNIEITTGGGSDKVMAAVLSGHIDIGLAGPESCIYVNDQGYKDKIKIFAQLTKKDAFFLISKYPIKNFKFKDLIGCTIIAGRKGGMPYISLVQILRKNNIEPGRDVTLDTSVNPEIAHTSFINGRAEFATLLEPTASTVVKQEKGYFATSMAEHCSEIPYTVYFAKESYIINNPKIIKKFTNAIASAQKWVYSNTAEQTALSISKFFPNIDFDLLVSCIKKYKDAKNWSDTPD